MLSRQQTGVSRTVSQVQKILPSLYEKNVGQTLAGKCRRAAKIKLLIVLESAKL